MNGVALFFLVKNRPHLDTWSCSLRLCVVSTGDASRFVVARADFSLLRK